MRKRLFSPPLSNTKLRASEVVVVVAMSFIGDEDRAEGEKGREETRISALSSLLSYAETAGQSGTRSLRDVMVYITVSGQYVGLIRNVFRNGGVNRQRDWVPTYLTNEKKRIPNMGLFPLLAPSCLAGHCLGERCPCLWKTTDGRKRHS